MHVIVGVTGGIAAYKATGIIRLLTEAGHTVKVVPTQNALRFIGATTLEALSHNSVDPDLYTDVESVKHVELGKQADLVIVAPASASFLARYAAGIADDLLNNILLVTEAPVVLAPAMHSQMWLHAANQENIATLESRGVHILAPAVGRLTGDDTGIGRLPEPEEIVDFALAKLLPQDLAGKHIVVTAGGTREPIDPVRYIGNRSSGKQGIAIVKNAIARGAKITLIAANLDETPASANLIVANTATELASAVDENLAQADALIMCAAVADYRVLNQSATKLKKSELGSSVSLELTENIDVLKNAVQKVKQNGLDCLTVGFAAETQADAKQLTKLAQDKLQAKGCDLLVANDVSAGKVFDSTNNRVLILGDKLAPIEIDGTKHEVAKRLLDVISDMLD